MPFAPHPVLRAIRAAVRTTDRARDRRIRRRALLALTAPAGLAVALLALGDLAAQPTGQPSPPAVIPTPSAVQGLQPVGYAPLGQPSGCNAGVSLHGGAAYVGDSCGPDGGGRGTTVLDVSDPTAPRVLARLGYPPGTWSLDPEGWYLAGPAFTGNVLLEPLDGSCQPDIPGAGAGALRLWDVRQPSRPARLGELPTGDGLRAVAPFRRDGRSYVALAAGAADTQDNRRCRREDDDLDASFVVAEISDPTAPEIVGRLNIHDTWDGLPPDSLANDVVVSADGRRAYVAYWDAGVVAIDLSDLASPYVLGRHTYPPAADGNAAGLALTDDAAHLVVTDQDAQPVDDVLTLLEPPLLAGRMASRAAFFSAPLVEAPPVEAPLAWVGRGCPPGTGSSVVDPDPYLTDADGKIAVVMRGACWFIRKVERARDEGALAAIIINHTPGDGPAPMGGGPGPIPATSVSWEDGGRITRTLTSGITVTARLEALPGAWGFTRVLDVTDPAAMHEVARHTLSTTLAYPPAGGENAWLTAYRPSIDGRHAFLAHTGAGVRWVDLSEPTAPVERGFLVPPDTEDDAGERLAAHVVDVTTDPRGRAYAVDARGGLWVLQPTDGLPQRPLHLPRLLRRPTGDRP